MCLLRVLGLFSFLCLVFSSVYLLILPYLFVALRLLLGWGRLAFHLEGAPWTPCLLFSRVWVRFSLFVVLSVLSLLGACAPSFRACSDLFKFLWGVYRLWFFLGGSGVFSYH